MSITHLDRPSLDYWHALDYCAGQAWHTKQPITLLTSSQFYAQHLYDRLYERQPTLIDTTKWSPANSAYTIALADWQPISGTWIWAEPSHGTQQTILKYWLQTAQQGDQLFVISSNWLAKRLPEWQQAPYPSITPAGPRTIQQTLHDHGLKIEQLYGFHGPVSIALGYTALGFSKIKQFAWSDRFNYAMRKFYTTEGLQAHIAPVQVRVVVT